MTAVRVRHHLAAHELLGVDALAELAEALPPASVEHDSGQVASAPAFGIAPRLDAAAGEVARRIETNGCCMVLRNVEQVHAYDELLHTALGELARHLPEEATETSRREGFVFLSAPGSATPAHVDPEHTLQLQVRGTRTLHLGRFADEDAEQLELERHYGGHADGPATFEDPIAFALEPGEGLYVPVNAPHSAHNGHAVSVSLSITWRTRASERLQRVHAVNARFRRAGISPARPGERPRADRAKALAGRVVERLAR